MSVYIIAEAGVNHNGDCQTARELIKQAKWAGCDCVKFQTFKAERLVTYSAPMADYQIENTHKNDSQYQMLKKLELSQKQFIELKQYADRLNIDFLSTPFDEESAQELEKIGMTRYKISSGDLTNKPLLQKVALYHKPMLISTGMANMTEVDEAVGWIRECGNENIVLLHCTTNYPTPFSEVNMNAMLELEKRYGNSVGYSDHTPGIEISLMAVALGAVVIEKHFTLDKNMYGPDHKASLEPCEMKKMVDSIRNIEAAFGDGIKKPTASEIKIADNARKSLVYARDICAGAILSKEDIICKRPGTGIKPKYMDSYIGKRVNKNCLKDTLVREDDV